MPGRRERCTRRRLRALTLAAVTALGSVAVVMVAAPPAAACACGVFVPGGGSSTVNGETSLLRWDGGTEDIVMRLSVVGTSANAAWVLPTPQPATVRLADPAVFTELGQLTSSPLAGSAPQHGVGAGATPLPTVHVISSEELGPFQVATLSATDPNALSNWLSTNGYRLPPAVAGALGPYVAAHWYYVAAKLTPSQQSMPLTGMLQPLRATFKSASPVYPMRLSAVAPDSEGLTLYVLTPTPVTRAIGGGLTGAPTEGLWLDPSAVAGTALQSFVSSRMYLSLYSSEVVPSEVNGDVQLVTAESGGATSSPGGLGNGALAGIAAGGLAVLAVLFWLSRARLAGRRRTVDPAGHQGP